jgi:hypothetical protein
MWFSFTWVLAVLGGLFVTGLASAFVGAGMGAFGGPPTPAPGPLIGVMGVPLFGAGVAAVAAVHYFRRKG